ncbi:response regulator [Blastopirellula marina]|uniref:Two-component system response regulator n=1 Tax=Blastopirellula marina TaxID=124 RepID=A0A2S8F9Q7_9BACT|nr:response regulator [Blastopirellula marina]PQO28684.1 two-component system response regulator [Blastopirellula marina]PTL41957.1 HDOD domain-containing protein [Blastopirellula marina]
MTKILFVDDQANVLSALRRMLHGRRDKWEMEFAGSGEEAIGRLEKESFDVVVTDMRMPGVDGAELLTHARDRWPSIVRIVLSGQSEPESILRTMGTTHIYLSKPCDAARLTTVVTQSSILRNRLPDAGIKRIVSQLGAAPCQASIYDQFVKELENPYPSIERLGALIASDIGMTAKILQLVSSSFFGQPQRVSTPEQAASLLGVTLLRELVLSSEIFQPMHLFGMEGFSLEELNRHSREVADCARMIAELETSDQRTIDDAWLAGMLHDVGKIVLACSMPGAYQEAVRLAESEGTSLWAAEKEVFGTTHAEVGSYLLSLWGLPLPICEAVGTFRSHRSFETEGNFLPVTAVHVANVLRRKNLLPERIIKPGMPLPWHF